MKFADKLPEQKLLVPYTKIWDTMGYGTEIEVGVTMDNGLNIALIGIRSDGTYVSYSGNKALKEKLGFQVNSTGQIKKYGEE